MWRAIVLALLVWTLAFTLWIAAFWVAVHWPMAQGETNERRTPCRGTREVREPSVHRGAAEKSLSSGEAALVRRLGDIEEVDR